MMKFLAGVLLVALLFAATSVLAATSEVRLKARTFTPNPTIQPLDDAIDAGTDSRHFYIQLEAFPDAVYRAELADQGIHLVQYIPDNTWIATFESPAMSNVALRGRLVWVGEILATDKMPLEWQRGEIGTWALQPDGRFEMRVRFHEDADVDLANELLRSLGAEIIGPMSIFKGATILATESTAPLFAELDMVAWISEGLPPLQLANDQARDITNATVVQEAPYDLQGTEVLIGEWDGGLVDDGHDDLQGRVLQMESGGLSNHATHVAGTVMGDGTLSESHGGTPLQYRGMAPDAFLLSWNFFGDVPNEVINGVSAYDVDMTTNSWTFGVDGGNCSLYGNYDFWAPEFDAITTGAPGKTLNVQFAASNERDDGDCSLVEGQYECIPPPSTAKNIITVGATNSDDDTMTGFSSWGPVDDGRLKPDVSAPGCQHFGEGAIRSTFPGDDYGLMCGTSMATPATTGCMALLYQLYNNMNSGADPEPTMIKALLIATGVDLGNTGPDFAFGHGRIDVRAAADALLSDSQVTLPVANGENHELFFPVPAGTPGIRLALVWHDPPASPSADPALINNLDLVLIAPDETLHYPWVLDPDSPSQPATRGVDNLNNVEHVHVDNPMAGTWRARITGTNVPEGPQITSLVGFDAKVPGAPIAFAVAEEAQTSISLTWTNAGDFDRKGTVIVRTKQGSFWFGARDGATYLPGQMLGPGVEIAYAADEDHSTDPFVDEGLTMGQTYEYFAYTYDDMHNYSVAATATGTAGDPASVESTDRLGAVLALGQAQPNPARLQVGFSFSLPGDQYARVRIYDTAGRLVRTLVDAPLSAGTYAASWDGRDDAGRAIAPGVYFYELRAGGERLSRQVSWMR